MTKKNERKPVMMDKIQLPEKKDVEIVKVPPRYLGTLTTDPSGTSNPGDYYYNGTNMRLFTSAGRKTV